MAVSGGRIAIRSIPTYLLDVVGRIVEAAVFVTVRFRRSTPKLHSSTHNEFQVPNVEYILE